jgi:uncharacterized membrane protein YdbT with pleckstrin-like domain
MAALDRHLAPDEAVVVRTRLHPIVFGDATFFALFVIGVVVLVVARNELAPRTVSLLALAAALLIVASFTPPAVRWWRSGFAVTDRRVLAQVGIFSAQVVEASLGRSTAVRIEQNMWGRLFGYATLRLAGKDGAVEVFPQVARAAALRDAIARPGRASFVGRGR